MFGSKIITNPSVPSALPKCPTVRERLREDTRCVHRALEEGTRINQAIARLPVEGISRDQLASPYREQYQKFLIIALALERGFERRLDHDQRASALLRSLDLFAEDPRSSCLIEEDLRTLGLRIPAQDLLCDQLPQVTTAGEAVGVHYVRLGSRLGGTMIGKCVERNLGPDAPRRFLTRYGRSVKTYVDDNFTRYDRLSAEQAELAIQSAKDTFQAILTWQQRIEHALEVPSVQQQSDGMFARIMRWLQK